jgi:hypothetical protein
MEMIEENRRQMLDHLWNLVSDPTITQDKLEEAAFEKVDNMSRLLFEAFDTHYVGLAQIREGANAGQQSSWSLTTVSYGWMEEECIFWNLFPTFQGHFLHVNTPYNNWVW